MKKLTPKQIEQYHTSREKGFLRFVLVRGILMWGVPMAIFMLVFKTYVQKENPNVGFTIILWLIMGILFGVMMWHAERTIYIKNMALRDKQPPE